MSKKLKVIILSLALLIAFFLRFYELESIPAGLHADAASQGYNAFSLLNTGKDRYGESYPILFRAFGSYQPPLYTYLTMIPVALFGNFAFSARFISALSGVILVLVTYFFTTALISTKNRHILAFGGAFIVAISPWSIFFSRLTVEANLGLLLFATSVLLFVVSLKKIPFFPVACLVLGLSTHAYYSERLISILFLPLFIWFFKDVLFKNKNFLVLGLCIFIVTQIPHLTILGTGAFERRFAQVSPLDNQTFVGSIGKLLLNNYLIYYSPANLFFDSGTNLGRMMPGLSVFYSWFIAPFLIGMVFLFKNRHLRVMKIVGMLLLLTPIPAGLTGDVFYPLRALDFLWVVTIVIALGIYQIYYYLKSNIIKLLVLGALGGYSLFSLYVAYFILFKYEKAKNYGYAYIPLMNKLLSYQDKNIIIDTSRDLGIGVRMAYFKKYDPKKMQEQLREQLTTPYYSGDVNADEVYTIDNIEVRPFRWGDAYKKNTIIVGDELMASPKQMEEHKLKPVFEIQDLSGKTFLYGYSTGQ